jgi:putative FmdB family regulatory protein
MPFYEYECESCNESFTTLRAMSDRDRSTSCPSCGSRKVKRKVSVFSAAGGDRSGAGRDAGSAGCGSGFS